MKLTEDRINNLIERIRSSKKYRHSDVNPETIRSLILQEAAATRDEKSLYKTVRKKLHNIVAPYLGEPDYDVAFSELRALEPTSLTDPDLQSLCLRVLSAHASTVERIPYQTEFYQRLFEVTGEPNSILDLACGLHPFAFPWMGLPLTTRYFAYDIIEPRIRLINQFFKTIDLAPLAYNQDILVHPPTQSADLAIFFKEAHRFEKRSSGANQQFWAALAVNTLAVSLPTSDLSGSHNLTDQQRALVAANQGSWVIQQELIFDQEIVFVLERKSEAVHHA